jgi:hypothetical protein
MLRGERTRAAVDVDVVPRARAILWSLLHNSARRGPLPGRGCAGVHVQRQMNSGVEHMSEHGLHMLRYRGAADGCFVSPSWLIIKRRVVS